MVCGGSNRRAEAWRWVTHLGQATGTPLSAGLVCATAVARLGVDGAVVALDTGDGWPEIRHATGELAWSLTELQATVGEGPYTDARTLGAPVLVGDLDAETSQRRWPLFAPLAVEAGAHALFTLPLRVGAIRVGALALHRSVPVTWRRRASAMRWSSPTWRWDFSWTSRPDCPPERWQPTGRRCSPRRCTRRQE